MLNRPTTAAHGLPGQPPLPLSYPAELYANHAPYQAHISPLGPNPSSLHPPGGMQGGIPTQLTGGGMSSQLTANSMHGAPPPGTGVPMGPMYLPVATPGGSGVGRGIAPGPSSGPPGMARAVLPNGQSRFAPGGAVRMGMPPHGTNGPQSAMTLPTTMGGLGGSVGMGVGRGGPQPGPGGNILSGGLNPAAKPLQRVSSTPNLHSPMHGMSAGPGYSPGPHFPPTQQHLTMPSQPPLSGPHSQQGQPKPGQPMQPGGSGLSYSGIQGMTFQQQLGGTAMPGVAGHALTPQPLAAAHMGPQSASTHQMSQQIQNPHSGTGMPMGLNPSPMGVDATGAPIVGSIGNSPNRNASPGQAMGSGGASAAGTPANAPTPGGSRNKGTPVNPQTPYPANPPTPSNRPGTSHQTPLPFPAQSTPRMQHADSMTFQNPQASPQQMPRSASRNGLQCPPGSMPPPNTMPPSSVMPPPPASAGPPSQASNPSINASTLRPTPAQILEHVGEVWGPGGANVSPYSMLPTAQPEPPRPGPGPGPGHRPGSSTTPSAPGGSLQQQHTGERIAPQHTGGGVIQHTAGGPLQPQHTGGSVHDQTMAPQHTGGSTYGDSISGPNIPGASGRGSVPNTPRRGEMFIPPNGPYSVHLAGNMRPPHSSIPSEISLMPGFAGRAAGEIGVDLMDRRGQRHNFGILRLLKFSEELRNLHNGGLDYWDRILGKHFTEDATLLFRAAREAGTTANSFVRLPYNLMPRFFSSFTQSDVRSMGLILDGATEYQEGADFSVHCVHARWPMHYANGYILELNGTLTAKCKTVPLQLPDFDPKREDGSTVPVDSVPPESTSNAGAQPLTSARPSLTQIKSSPANKPAITPGPTTDTPNSRVPMEVDAKPTSSSSNQPLSQLVYIVKIEEFQFDSRSCNRYIDVQKVQPSPRIPQTSSQQIPPSESTQKYDIPVEPKNFCGIPSPAMRTIEMLETNQAISPLMNLVDGHRMPPLVAMFDYVQKQNLARDFSGISSHMPMGAPYNMASFHSGISPDAFAMPPSGLPQGSLPEVNGAYVSDVPMSGIFPSSVGPNHSRPNTGVTGAPPTTIGVDPSSLSFNGPMPIATPGTSSNAPVTTTPGNSSAPSLSPNLSTKIPGKKNAVATSPTKGNNETEKEKGGGKRKNTTEGSPDAPPNKRTRIGKKGSKA